MTLGFSCEKNRSSNQNHQWHYFHMLEKKFVQSENHSGVWVSHQVSCLLVYQTAIFVWEGVLHDNKKYLKISWSRSCLELHPIRVNSKIIQLNHTNEGCHLCTLFLGCCYKFTSVFETFTDVTELCQNNLVKNTKPVTFWERLLFLLLRSL